MTDEAAGLAEARRHVKNVRDFFYHLMTYVFVSGLLVVVDRLSGPNDRVAGLDWAFWIVLFWGIGVAGHAVFAFFDDYRARRLMVHTGHRS